MITTEDIVRIDTFKDLDPRQRERVRGRLLERIYAAGDTVFAEGDPGDSVYFIVEGAVQVLRKTESGRPRLLAHIRDGWLVGEMAILDRGPRSATVLAVGKTRMACLRLVDFEALLSDDPVTASLMLRRVARMLSLRLRKTSSLIT